MKNITLLIILMNFVTIKTSLCQDNMWLYGSDSFSQYSQLGGSSIDFMLGSAIVSNHPRQMNFLMTNANISDSYGNLLFYTNGISIQNRQDALMLNGDSLNPGIYTSLWYQLGLNFPQGALILPSPVDSNIYYLFHETLDPDTTIGSGPPLPLHLFYSVIDMRLDSGKGGVILKNQILLSDSLFIGGLTAVKHGDGNEWWILVKKYNSDKFYKILLNSQGGFNISSESLPGLPYSPDLNQNIGQCVFSPDGTKYAFYIAGYGLGIIDFDRCLGRFKTFKYLSRLDGMWCGGVAFSPNSNVLYVSSSLYLYQLNLDSNIQIPVFDTIAVYDNFYDSLPISTTTFFLAQLALDGKIYINSWTSSRYLSVINNPDSLGAACNFTQHSLNLQTYNNFTLPNFPNYKLGEINDSCDKLNTSENFLIKNEFELFPNPTNNDLFIKFKNENLKFELKLFSIDGKLIEINKEYNSHRCKLDIRYLDNGIYIVSIASPEENYFLKFIKN